MHSSGLRRAAARTATTANKRNRSKLLPQRRPATRTTKTRARKASKPPTAGRSSFLPTARMTKTTTIALTTTTTTTTEFADDVRFLDDIKEFNLLMPPNNATASAKKNGNGNGSAGGSATRGGGNKSGGNPNLNHMQHPNKSAKNGTNAAAQQKLVNTSRNAGEGRRMADINGMTALGFNGLGGYNGGGFRGSGFHGYTGLPSHGGEQHQHPMLVNKQGYQARPSSMMSSNLGGNNMMMMHDNRYMQPQMMYLRSPQIPPYAAYYNCYPSHHDQSNQSCNVTHLFSDENTKGCVVM
ncbi:unnamed protein product [Musa textilis]